MSKHFTMCFSSSIICLLIVTSHGSVVPGHHASESDGSENARVNNTQQHRHDIHQQSPESNHVDHSHQPFHPGSSLSKLEKLKQSSSDNHHAYSLNDTDESSHYKLSDDTSHEDNDSFNVEENSSHSNSQENVQKGHQETSHPCHSSDKEGDDSDHHKHHNNHHKHDDSSSAGYHQPYSSDSRNISAKVWLYASLAVVIISLCGLLSVAVIPIMQKWFYHTLLQFLVGLAVGSLSGDGLLHLMPHAILDGEGTHEHDGHNHSSGLSLESMERTAIWRGLAALGGIFLFFIAERLLGALTAHRRQKKEAKLSRHSKNMMPVIQREDGANNGNVGEKLAQPKKNSYDHIREKDEKETIQMLQTEATPSRKGSGQSSHEVGFHGRSSFSIEPETSVAYRPDSESSVIVSDHHGHGHGHSHEIPHSVSAVAWMVIMGDGLHNFCDGLAIGAAFASGDADGISTTVAVFCHELPHELGDFAMLLKTGMKVKQALFYNGLSSILCFFGMVIGVLLGNVTSATNWVFAGTAGMFLYIALVDMLPELTSGNESGRAAISTLLVQVIGICMGICIMLLIAIYEHKLHSIVS